jgi:maleate isomerase
MPEPPRIGAVHPDDQWIDQVILEMIDDWQAFLPPGVELVSAHHHHPNEDCNYEVSVRIIESDGVEEAARRLMRYKPPDLFAYMCTTTSFIRGPGYDIEIADRIQAATGVPAFTTSTAVVEALQALKIDRVALASVYLPDVEEQLLKFLAGHGIEVVSRRSLSLARDHELSPPKRIRAAAEAADDPEAQGVLISGTGQRTAGFLAELEIQLGKPVVTANQASMWQAVQMLGLEPHLPGKGELFNGSYRLGR